MRSDHVKPLVLYVFVKNIIQMAIYGNIKRTNFSYQVVFLFFALLKRFSKPIVV